MQINTEQLRNGKREAIELTLPPDFLGVHEKELFFTGPVHLKGEAYEADDHLVLQLSAKAEIQMSCSICNEMTVFPLKAQEIFYTVLLQDLKSPIFDFTDVVREELVLMIPQFVECGGRCPEREQISKFIKDKPVSDQNNFPFADL